MYLTSCAKDALRTAYPRDDFYTSILEKSRQYLENGGPTKKERITYHLDLVRGTKLVQLDSDKRFKSFQMDL